MKSKHFTSRLRLEEALLCFCLSVFVQGKGRHMACVHSTSSPLPRTVRGCLKHSCQWSSVSPPIHPQSCLLCNYSSACFCSAPNLEAALWSARARPSFRGGRDTRPRSPSPPTPPFLLFILRSRSVLIYKALKGTQLAN